MSITNVLAVLQGRTVVYPLKIWTSQRYALKVHRLPHHWTHSTHLKNQPLHRFWTLVEVMIEKSVTLLRQIPQNGTRLKHNKFIVASVDNRGNSAIGIQFEVPFGFLLVLIEIKLSEFVGYLCLFQENDWLPTVHREGGIEMKFWAYHAIRIVLFNNFITTKVSLNKWQIYWIQSVTWYYRHPSNTSVSSHQGNVCLFFKTTNFRQMLKRSVPQTKPPLLVKM